MGELTTTVKTELPTADKKQKNRYLSNSK